MTPPTIPDRDNIKVVDDVSARTAGGGYRVDWTDGGTLVVLSPDLDEADRMRMLASLTKDLV